MSDKQVCFYKGFFFFLLFFALFIGVLFSILLFFGKRMVRKQKKKEHKRKERMDRVNQCIHYIIMGMGWEYVFKNENDLK